MKNFIFRLNTVLLLAILVNASYATPLPLHEKAPPCKMEFKQALLNDGGLIFKIDLIADFDCQKFYFVPGEYPPIKNSEPVIHYGLNKFTSKSHKITTEDLSLLFLNRVVFK